MISKRLTVLVCLVVMIGGRAPCAAQSEGLFASWEDRVRATLSSSLLGPSLWSRHRQACCKSLAPISSARSHPRGKFKLERDPRNRLALIFSGGMQIATSQFHTYNRGLVLTARMLF